MLFLKNLKFHQVLRTTGKRNYPERRNIKENSRLLEVSIDSLLDFDENVSVRLSSKKSVLKKLSAIPQRFNSLKAVVETTDEQKLAIAKYVGCPIWWLVNEQDIKFEPKDTSPESDNSVLFMILDIMDGCADNDIDKAMQIQLSRVVLYHLNEKDSERKS